MSTRQNIEDLDKAIAAVDRIEARIEQETIDHYTIPANHAPRLAYNLLGPDHIPTRDQRFLAGLAIALGPAQEARRWGNNDLAHESGLKKKQLLTIHNVDGERLDYRDITVTQLARIVEALGIDLTIRSTRPTPEAPEEEHEDALTVDTLGPLEMQGLINAHKEANGHP